MNRGIIKIRIGQKEKNIYERKKETNNRNTKCINSSNGRRICITSPRINNKWYVIKNSPIEEDYVTVIKEKILTKKELGNYAYTGSRTSYLGNTVMSYYWDDSCHPDAYGYSSENYNCNNTNNYETSKVKEFLEGTYINTLGTNNLKEVDGYKIRLLTVDELISNLGLVNPNNTVITNNENANVPTWIYLDIGSNPNNYSHEFAYWTMTPFADNSSDVRNVEQMHNREGHIKSSSVIYPNGVRPVINLLKDAIE